MQKTNNLSKPARLTIFRLVTIWLLAASLSGCNTTKFLKEGDSFYTGSKIKFDTKGKRIGRKKVLEKELQTFITPKPNGSIFGMRIGVWFYMNAAIKRKV